MSLRVMNCYPKLSSDSDAHLLGADLKAPPSVSLSTCLEASNSHLDAQDGGC